MPSNSPAKVILHVHAFLESANVDRENLEQPLECYKHTHRTSPGGRKGAHIFSSSTYEFGGGKFQASSVETVSEEPVQ